MRVLIDTCIIIDALQSREPFCDAAQKIFLHAANKDIDGIITAKAATDIYYLTHRSLHDDKKTRKVLASLFYLFDLADTSGIDCRKSIFSEISDYEDAVMHETALRENVDCIVTRNIKDYKNAVILVLSPEELLRKR